MDVTGMLKDEDEDLTMGFSRTFVLVPHGTGIVITNDAMVLNCPPGNDMQSVSGLVITGTPGCKNNLILIGCQRYVNTNGATFIMRR